jgi:hypothetical protein
MYKYTGILLRSHPILRISRIRVNVAFYIFEILAVDVRKWSLSLFKRNTSGLHQTLEMIFTEYNSDTL